jgi:NitT/TauT family transport system substrate-binding protein
MRIRLSENFRAVFYAPFYLTQELGYFAAEGIEVELLTSSAPAAAAAGLLDGSIDIAWGGPMRVMKDRDNDANSPMACFCAVAARDPFYLVGKRPDGQAFKLADLPRLKLGVVSEVPTPWLCLQHDLRLAGIDPETIKRVTGPTMAENLEALRACRLDVVQMFEPYVSMALESGAGEVLHAASSRGPTVYTTFLAARNSIRRNHVAFEKMVRATHASLKWVAAHSGAELADAVKSYYPNVSREILSSSLERYHKAKLWAETPEISRVGFDRLADSLRTAGYVSRQHSYDDCVDQTFST